MSTLLLIYFVKVSMALILFYGLHMLLIRNETFFGLRRLYFLLIVVFSFCFPFLSIETASGEPSIFQTPFVLLNEIEVSNIDTSSANGLGAWSAMDIILGLWIGGSVVFLIRFLMQLGSIVYLLKNKKVKRYQSPSYLIEVTDESIPTFSFFRWIVINTHNKTEKQIDDMLKHESIHSQQLHSLDVFVYEILCIILWWNPSTWLLKEEMKLNLEYLADAGVQQGKENIKEYQYLLLQITNANSGVAIINNLNVSQLKKRIIMMNKKRSSMLSAAKYLLLVPLALLMIQCNSGEENETTDPKPDTAPIVNLTIKEEKEEPFNVVEQMPKFVGGVTEMMKHIQTNLQYPKAAIDQKIEGRVVVRFTVESTGKVSDAKILRGLSKECDEESLRVVELMPDWEPGKQGGKAVAVYFTLPIAFKLAK